MGDADFVTDSRAAGRPRWRDQRLGGPGATGNRKWAVAPVFLWGTAAVLAVVAPFLQLFVFAVPTGRGRSVDGVDGWGRVGAAFGPHQPHEPRFGIALWVCGFGLAWLAVQRGRAIGRAELGLDLVTAGTAVGLPCLLAGVAGSLVLYVQSYANRFSSITLGSGEPHLHRGWGTWLSLTSLGLAIAATTILFWPGRAATGDDEPDLDDVGNAGRL
jgi:hypothetical protein